MVFHSDNIRVKNLLSLVEDVKDKQRTTPSVSLLPVKKVFLCIFAFILHTIFLLVCKTVGYKDNLCE